MLPGDSIITQKEKNRSKLLFASGFYEVKALHHPDLANIFVETISYQYA